MMMGGFKYGLKRYAAQYNYQSWYDVKRDNCGLMDVSTYHGHSRGKMEVGEQVDEQTDNAADKGADKGAGKVVDKGVCKQVGE